MGQAWCKEKTTKVQNSKSPLDRAFFRCAHRIYPNLKEESSVLGGATQRVRSSEIGYASSPPRSALLTRGHSIDSVDRPFHPSEWVDVNLEVPGTPRVNPMLTHLSSDSSCRYPLTTITSSYMSLKEATPVPPPRKRKRNKRRPLPPKPDEVLSDVSNREGDSNDDPLYSSVRCDYANIEEPIRRIKEVHEHKVNGNGRIISRDVLSGWNRSFDKRSSDVKSHRKVKPDENERERLFEFAESDKDNGRTKNCSTCSLPSYGELASTRLSEKVWKNSSTEAILQQSDKLVSKENAEANGDIGREDGADNLISKVACGASSDFADSAKPPSKHESMLRSSTPMKGAIGDDSILKLDEWFREKGRRHANSSTDSEELFHTALQESSSTNVENSRKHLLRRMLSNESEPFESFEEKELSLQLERRTFGELVRTISEESLPQEMLEDVVDGTDIPTFEPLNDKEVDFFEEKTACLTGKLREEIHSSKTPPPSPEPKIKAQIVENLDRSLKRKKDSKGEDGSNLSSMTPSLNELEEALSDMLEKKDGEEDGKTPEQAEEDEKFAADGLIEAKIVPVKKEDVHCEIREPGEKKSLEVEIVGFDFKKKPNVENENTVLKDNKLASPEKPSRMRRISLDNPGVENMPTPPRRRNRSSFLIQTDSPAVEDRLI